MFGIGLYFLIAMVILVIIIAIWNERKASKFTAYNIVSSLTLLPRTASLSQGGESDPMVGTYTFNQLPSNGTLTGYYSFGPYAIIFTGRDCMFGTLFELSEGPTKPLAKVFTNAQVVAGSGPGADRIDCLLPPYSNVDVTYVAH
jgi:hypothetical protein